LKTFFFVEAISTGAGTQLQVQRFLVHHLAAVKQKQNESTSHKFEMNEDLPPSFEPEMQLQGSFLPLAVLLVQSHDRTAGVQATERE
jgi:hypothetical protein